MPKYKTDANGTILLDVDGNAILKDYGCEQADLDNSIEQYEGGQCEFTNN
jgi:hypothetical protein